MVINESKRKLGRRRILKALFAFIAGVVAWPLARYLSSSSSPEPMGKDIELSVDPEKESAGKDSFIVMFNGRPVLVIKTDDAWSAFDGICTHMGCPLHYDDDTGNISCACHEGQYDLAGRVVSGPPPKALKVYRVERREGSLVIHY